MITEYGNIFKETDKADSRFEKFEAIAESECALVERILSAGQKTPDGTWLEQDRNEWVILLDGEAEVSFKDGRVFALRSGDYLYIPSNTKHRVNHTSTTPPCIWLAFHFE